MKKILSRTGSPIAKKNTCASEIATAFHKLSKSFRMRNRGHEKFGTSFTNLSQRFMVYLLSRRHLTLTSLQMVRNTYIYIYIYIFVYYKWISCVANKWIYIHVKCWLLLSCCAPFTNQNPAKHPHDPSSSNLVEDYPPSQSQTSHCCWSHRPLLLAMSQIAPRQDIAPRVTNHS